MSERTWHVRISGRAQRALLEAAERIIDSGYDLDLADAISRAKVKPHGFGHRVWIPVETGEQVRELSRLLLAAGLRDDAGQLRHTADELDRLLDPDS